MNTVMPVKQRGVSFGGYVFGAFLLVVVSIYGFKFIPAYMEDAKIKNLFIAIAHDPDMQRASLHDIQVSFNKRASIDNITAVKGDDIDVSSDGGRLVLSASYSVKIPLGGNVSVLLDFKPTSEK